MDKNSIKHQTGNGTKNKIFNLTTIQSSNIDVLNWLRHLQGAEIDVRSIVVGDETMSVLEIWGAEYQEQVH